MINAYIIVYIQLLLRNRTAVTINRKKDICVLANQIEFYSLVFRFSFVKRNWYGD